MLSGKAYWAVVAQHDIGESGVVFLGCIDCPATIKKHYEHLDSVTDEEAGKVFKKRGWTIKPTRCPRCAKRAAAAPADQPGRGSGEG